MEDKRDAPHLNTQQRVFKGLKAVMTTSITLNADLQCELDGIPLSISAANRRIVVEVPDVATAMKMLRLGSPRGSYFSFLRRLKQQLDDMQIHLVVNSRRRTLVELGYQVGSRRWKMVGLPRMKLHLLSSAFLAVRQHLGFGSDRRR